ncbi:CHAT domain-containing protein [Planktothrix sp. FACHB-1355]|uniref:CHAT domain-containing protein n=1 Tax=Aerosakkonema funiforme FACHB-1375 TaxID=2949571 RepID=A0A926VEM9_9CYAN|nr:MULTISPECIES: CHAT domain-containing tetratricopeptide repeat protein [Oscillatoriales]MBD2181064.1 CHAT domain-containing protein [Aerosakkonema funiforme FACHB-1375]MBD3559684.1 CHAT domain-containing protein [Planktothrix sp. FACHB-1355]
MRPWKLTLSSVSLLVTVSTALPINLLVPFSVPQVLAQTVEERKAEADRLFQQGLEQYHTSQIEVALQSWKQALTMYREIKDRQAEAKVQSLAVAREIKNLVGEGSALCNLGIAYDFLGDYAKAIEYQQQSLVVAREIKDRQLEKNVLGNLGNAYNSLGDYTKAIDYYQQSFAIARELKDRVGEGQSLGDLGNVYNSLRDYTKAIDYYQESLAIAREIKDRDVEGTALRNLGNAYRFLGNYTKAIEYVQQSLAIAREIKNRVGEGVALNNLGAFLGELGKFSEAEIALRDGIEVWESLRVGLGSRDAEKVSIFERQAGTYQILQQVLIAQNKINEALEVAESGRARAFVDLLAINLVSPDYNTPSLTAKHIQKISKAQKAIIVQYSIIYNKFKIKRKIQGRESELYIWVVKPTGEIAFRQVDLKPLWQQQNTSLQELVSKNLELVSAGINRGESDNPTLSNNPSFAPGDLVRLNNDRPNYPAWQVVSVNPQNRTVRLRQPSFAEGVIIERPIADVTKVSSPNAQNKRLQQLHKLLIEPIADLLPTDPNARVIFIPQGALFFVPFPALQDADNKFLIEKHTILTAPSIQVLDLTHQQRQRVPGTTKDVLVVGNPTMPEVSPFPGEPARQLSPLPAAEREATEVAQMFKTQALIGNQATKTAILSQLSKARIIHLATHGLLHDYTGGGVPGAIALAPSPNDNGLLTASEILDLKLNAELVVLSACNTGKGRITGDGVIGLSRSLISAGVPSVVVSLWSVPDAPTASLMTEFYRQMQRSPDKAQALRQAMLTTIRTHPNPKDWAAFTLIGEAE